MSWDTVMLDDGPRMLHMGEMYECLESELIIGGTCPRSMRFRQNEQLKQSSRCLLAWASMEDRVFTMIQTASYCRRLVVVVNSSTSLARSQAMAGPLTMLKETLPQLPWWCALVTSTSSVSPEDEDRFDTLRID